MNGKRSHPERTVTPRTAANTLACVVPVLALGAALLGGCSGLGADRHVADAITIERVDSTHAEITSAQVSDQEGRIEVWGRLKKRFAGRSPIPGHLHVEALDGDVSLLAQTTTSYPRLNPKMGLSEFSQPLPVGSDRVRVVRVTHHPEHNADDS